MINLITNTSLFPLLVVSLFFAILFIQSGFDKIVDFNGNLNYFKNHFQHTIFKNWTRLLLIIILLMELVTGLFFLAALLEVFIIDLKDDFSFSLIFFGLSLSAITICCLFLGQRLAKDYAGASTLTIYFALNLLGFLFLSIAK